jgi:DNA-directed RNA polymerase subunit H (RpoH/RPB5)
MTDTILTDLLRKTVRMILARGFNLKSGDEFYHALENEKFNDDNIVELFGDVSNSASKPAVFNNALKTHILRNVISDSKNVKNFRNYQHMLMSDYFHKQMPDGSTEICMMFFANTTNKPVGKITKDDLDEMVNTFTAFKTITSAVFVTHSPLASNIVSEYNSIAFQSSRTLFTHFTNAEIYFDPTEHVYNSKSRVLEGEPLARFKENRINVMHLPRIYLNEPIAKYYGAKPGDIMEFQVESIIPDVLVEVEIFHRLVRKPVEKKKKVR